MLDVKGVPTWNIPSEEGKSSVLSEKSSSHDKSRVYKTLKLNRMSKVEVCDYDFSKVSTLNIEKIWDTLRE